MVFILRLVAGLWLVATGAGAQPSEIRGAKIYREGATAVSGEAALPLPPAFAACVKCHGPDGRGKIEAGVAPSDIRWEILTKPYAVALATGRQREPYDEARFFAALTRGVDSAGRALDPTMPRYQLLPDEAADLIAHLKKIGRAEDEGVTGDAIRLGFVRPGDPARATAAELDLKIFTTVLGEVNRAGGIFRRQLELRVIEEAEKNLSAPPLLAVLTAGEPGSPAAASPLPLLHYAIGRRERAPDRDRAARDLSRPVAVETAARMLVEALKQSGRELSREKLRETLKVMVDFDPGAAPPLE